mmetsp:Transcript_328/g.603  ORF Transcript_328/g.603 Transcript_328/m.603 type:complete len:547 (+) Transcript_328:3-1643(+)
MPAGMSAARPFPPGVSPTGSYGASSWSGQPMSPSMMRAHADGGYPGQPSAMRGAAASNPTGSAGMQRLSQDRIRATGSGGSAGMADPRMADPRMGGFGGGAGDASQGMRLGPAAPAQGAAEYMAARMAGVGTPAEWESPQMPHQRTKEKKKSSLFQGVLDGLGEVAHHTGFGEEFKMLRAKGREAKLGLRSWVAEKMEAALANHDENQINYLLDQALDSTLTGESTPHVISHAAGKIAQKRLQEALQADDPKALKAAVLMANRLNSTHLPEYQQVVRRYASLRQFPEGWAERLDIQRRGGKLVAVQEIQDPNVLALFQVMLDATLRKVYTRDRMGQPVPDRLMVVSVTKIENGDHWVDYMSQQETIRRAIHADSTGYQRLIILTMTGELEEVSQQLTAVTGTPPLDSLVNEAWLFHGTSAEAARRITKDEFKISRAGSNAGTLYGRGVYLAENSSKSDEYSQSDPQGLRSMLICRTTLGRAFYSDDVNVNPRSCEDICMHGPYHSILGDRLKARGTFREFIVYDEDQVYPNFIVRYRQLMNPGGVA